MLTVRTKLDRSIIAGIGLFALESIKKGKEIYRHNGRFTIIIEKDEIEQMPQATQEMLMQHAYYGKDSFRLQEAVYYNIDDSKYMNHSENPNLLWIADLAIYIAKEDIEVGIELTCDYNDFAIPGDPCFNW